MFVNRVEQAAAKADSPALDLYEDDTPAAVQRMPKQLKLSPASPRPAAPTPSPKRVVQIPARFQQYHNKPATSSADGNFKKVEEGAKNIDPGIAGKYGKTASGRWGNVKK